MNEEAAREQRERAELGWALGERVKELTMLHRVARLLHRGKTSVNEVITAIVELLPGAFQFPDITRARITYAGASHENPGFRELPAKLSASYRAASGLGLTLEVVYLDRDASNPALEFLDEEHTLLESLAELIGGAFEQRAAQERVELAVRGTGAALWEWDLRSNEVFWSEDMERLAGLAPGAFDGTLEGFRALVHPDDDASMRLAMRPAFDDPKATYSTEFRLIRADGECRWLSSLGRVERGPDGAPWRMLGLAMDVTERRALEDHLRQAQKLEAVGSLAAGIAHDFNNMLSIILSYADLALLDLVPGAPLRSELEEIKAAAARAGDLTRHLLAFSRQQVLEPRVFDLNATVGGIEKMLRRLLDAAIELTLTRAPNLGSIHADPGQIEQVLVNLVVNARDAMPRGGQLSIQTSNVDLDEAYTDAHVDVAPGRYVMLAVSDSGVGMTPEVRARIFDPFFTTKGLGKGTGLGLATVFGTVRQSGGHIWVYSEPGQGTAFKLYFPRIDRPADSVPAPRPVAEALEGNETILLVEDEEQVRVLARTILARSGYDVLEAKNSAHAVELCERHAERVSLLLADTVMPLMGGPELAEKLTAIAPRLRVLHMSGYTDAAVVHQRILGRGAAFIQKPLTPRALLLKVREVLDAKRG